MTNWGDVQLTFEAGLVEILENQGYWKKVAEDLGYEVDVVVARKLSVNVAKHFAGELDEEGIAFAIESRLCDFGWFPTTYEARAKLKGQSLSVFLASVFVEGLKEFTKKEETSDEEKYIEQIRRQQCPGCGDTDIV